LILDLVLEGYVTLSVGQVAPHDLLYSIFYTCIIDTNLKCVALTIVELLGLSQLNRPTLQIAAM